MTNFSTTNAPRGAGRTGGPHEGSTTNILRHFDRAYVVNLPERTDRRREMERELARMSLLDPLKLEFFPATRVNEAQGFPSVGARGCFLSHLAILRQAHRAGHQRILIMEDDLEFAPEWPASEAAVASRLAQDDWAFAYLGHSDPADVPADATSPLCEFTGLLMMTHFYALRGEYIEQVITFLEELLTRDSGDPKGGPMHIDGAYYTFRMQHPQALTLIAHPNLGRQRSSASDVHRQWYDATPILETMARAYRWTRRRAHQGRHERRRSDGLRSRAQTRRPSRPA